MQRKGKSEWVGTFIKVPLSKRLLLYLREIKRLE